MFTDFDFGSVAEIYFAVDSVDVGTLAEYAPAAEDAYAVAYLADYRQIRVRPMCGKSIVQYKEEFAFHSEREVVGRTVQNREVTVSCIWSWVSDIASVRLPFWSHTPR